MSGPFLPPDDSTRLAPALVRWQRQHGRHTLPWQGTRDPYRVWLSEIMLQQTQVSTVLGYYARFLARFPDVQALAAAPLDDVLAQWSGLGYYSRARHLHRCAQVVVQQHGGRFPPSAAELQTLPGIGRSTAAAIAVFCFGERAAILDGNVKRVLTRVLGVADDLAEPRHERALWQRAQDLLPERAADLSAYTQGLMDLGATLCTPRRPQCLLCPWAPRCEARAQGRPEAYPVKTRRLKRGQRRHALLWLVWRGQVWLVPRPATGVWAGLWSLPEWPDLAALQAFTQDWPGVGEARPEFKHVLTHLDLWLTPWRWHWPDAQPAPDPAALCPHGEDASTGRWVPLAEALAMGLPAPVRKLLLAETPSDAPEDGPDAAGPGPTTG